MFNINDYPKSFASIKPNDYRLKDYLDKSPNELIKIENKLWKFINKELKEKKPIISFKNYKYLSSGWEFSVFLKNPKTVIKIPSGVFSEVNSPIYLRNVEFAYKKILEYFPKMFVAKTTFKRINGINTITQSYIKGKDNFFIGYNTKNKKLL